MNDKDRLKVNEEEAKAWRSISTWHSLCCYGGEHYTMNVTILLETISKEKKRIDKLIDNLPE